MKTYHLFVSHGWRYSEHYLKVISWLDEAKANHRFEYSNYSDPKDDPIIASNEAIKKARMKGILQTQIQHSSVVIVLAGMYATYSEWIDFEIDEAVKMGKYIIGLSPWGQERTPAKVADNADVMVRWNSESLISAILNSGV